MPRVFLSHSSRDNFEAIALREWLKTEGWDDVFLDLDPEGGIAAGERWERALHAAASHCEAVIFLVSQNWLNSRWCIKEYGLSRGLNKKLFAVLISDALSLGDLPEELTGTWQVVELTGGQNLRLIRSVLPGSHEEKHVGFTLDGLRRLKLGLEKAGLAPSFFAWPPPSEPERRPYRGLKAFEQVDAGVFFGREAPIGEALDRLRGLQAGAAPRLLVILGASGAGKSSFLRAGLLPRLTRDDSHFLPFLQPIRPGRSALTGDHGFLGMLTAAFPEKGRAELRSAMMRVAALRALLGELVNEALSRRPNGFELAKPPVILIAVDQAEELFWAEGAQESAALLGLLRALVTSDDPAVIVVFAIRSDSYDALEHAKAFEGLCQAALPLLPLPRSLFSEVISGPARRVSDVGGKLAFEPQLKQRLLEDLEQGGGSDTLPLLAFTLEQLILEFGGSGTLKLADYIAFGGLRGAIDAAIARVFSRADDDPRIPRDRAAREAVLRRGLIPWLAGVDPVSRTSRRHIARRIDIPAEAMPLIDLLIEERLLSTDARIERDPHSQAEARVTTIEPAHEALLRQWGLLQGWLEEDLGLLATLEGVQRATRDWDANGRATAWLAHQGQRLADAQALDARPDIVARLYPADRAYLAECRLCEDARSEEMDRRRREREEEELRRVRDARQLARRTTIGLVIASGLAILATGFGVFARWEEAIATQSSREALDQREAADRAHETADIRAVEANRSLAAALAALSQASLTVSSTDAAKFALAGWPRGARDKTPKLDVDLSALSSAVSDLRERRIFRPGGQLSDAAFSPDGLRVVTASGDAAQVWNVVTGDEITGPKTESDRNVSDSDETAVISPRGTKYINRASEIRNSSNGTLVGILTLGADAVSQYDRRVFSADETRILTTGTSNASIWEVSSGKLVGSITSSNVEEHAYYGFEFGWISPNGSQAVVLLGLHPNWNKDADPHLWDVKSGRILALRGHTGRVSHVAFSRDGSQLATSSSDRTVRIWSASTGKLMATLAGHEKEISSSSFSPDGTLLATASADGTARVWETATGRQVAVLRGHTDGVVTASFSRDGSRIVTSSRDKTSRIWDTKSGELLAVLSGHRDDVVQASFSDDGTRILTVSADRTARLWDAVTGLPTNLLSGQRALMSISMLSPDRKRIVSTTGQATALLAEAATGRRIAVLGGHKGEITRVSFSPDGRLIVTASYDHSARLWDGLTGKLLGVLRASDDPDNRDALYDGVGDAWVMKDAKFSADGSRLVTVGHDAFLWDPATGKQIATLGGSQMTSSATFSADGSRLVTVSDKVSVWDTRTGARIAAFEGEITTLSPNGTQIVIAGETGAKEWNVATGKLVAEFRSPVAVGCLSFSPDALRVVGVGDGTKTVFVWDASSGKLVSQLIGHEGKVACAHFSPDGARILSYGADKTVRLWDVQTGRAVVVLRDNDVIDSASFSPSGSTVVEMTRSAVRLWDIEGIPKGNLFQVACAWLPDTNLNDLATEYHLINLAPICQGDPPLPEFPAR